MYLAGRGHVNQIGRFDLGRRFWSPILPDRRLAGTQKVVVGVAGIEPATSCSQSRRATAAPHPDHQMIERGRAHWQGVRVLTRPFSSFRPAPVQSPPQSDAGSEQQDAEADRPKGRLTVHRLFGIHVEREGEGSGTAIFGLRKILSSPGVQIESDVRLRELNQV